MNFGDGFSLDKQRITLTGFCHKADSGGVTV
jgi:hypothetical protein